MRILASRLFLREVVVVSILVAVTIIIVLHHSSSNLFFNGYYSDEIYYVTASRVLANKLGYRHSCYTVVESNELVDLNKTIVLYNYTKFKGYYVCGSSVEGKAKYYGYRMPDHDYVVLNPLNIEHPYFGKLIVSLVMFIRDEPVYWRIAPLVFLVLIVVSLFYLVKSLSGSIILSSVTVSMLFLDNLFVKVCTTSMLDVYVTALTTLSLLLFIKRKYFSSILVSSLSLGFKLTGVVSVALVALLFIQKTRGLKQVLKHLFTIGYLSLSFFALSYSIVAIMYQYSVVEMISTGLKLLIGVKECEHCSPPWMWLIRGNDFPAFPRGNPLLYFSSILLSTLLIRRKTPGSVLRVSVLVSYLILSSIVLFRATYGFYIVTVIPLMYASLTTSVYEIINYVVFKQ